MCESKARDPLRLWLSVHISVYFGRLIWVIRLVVYNHSAVKQANEVESGYSEPSVPVVHFSGLYIHVN